jgi:hypothetical protein
MSLSKEHHRLLQKTRNLAKTTKTKIENKAKSLKRNLEKMYKNAKSDARIVRLDSQTKNQYKKLNQMANASKNSHQKSYKSESIRKTLNKCK